MQCCMNCQKHLDIYIFFEIIKTKVENFAIETIILGFEEFLGHSRLFSGLELSRFETRDRTAHACEEGPGQASSGKTGSGRESGLVG